MKSLQAGDRTLDFVDKAYSLGDITNNNSQHIISILKHQITVQKTLDIISERIHDPPTLGELASLSGLSRTYFSYIFKEVSGVKLQNYLIQTRLNKAKNLLGNIDLKIKQIAYETGFRDPNYFCRTFKKKTGLNPTNWRLKKVKNFPKGG